MCLPSLTGTKEAFVGLQDAWVPPSSDLACGEETWGRLEGGSGDPGG